MNPTEKENKRKVQTPSLKSNFTLGQNNPVKMHSNAGLGSKQTKTPLSVSKFSVVKVKSADANIPKAQQVSQSSQNQRVQQLVSQPGNIQQVSQKEAESIPQSSERNEIKEVIEMKEVEEFNEGNTHINQETNLPQQSLPLVNPFGTKTKRKFTELQKDKAEAKKASQTLLREFSIIYDEMVDPNKNFRDDELFSDTFVDVLNREGVIDYSRLLPESLDLRGSCLLADTKFFLCFIKFKIINRVKSEESTKFPLEDYLRLVENSLDYDQDDLRLIHSSFVNYVKVNYTNEEIFRVISKKHEIGHILSDKSELNESHFCYLLTKPDSFVNCQDNNMRPMREDSPSRRVKYSIGTAFRSKDKINTLSRLSMAAGLEGRVLDQTVNSIQPQSENINLSNEEQQENINNIINNSHVLYMTNIVNVPNPHYDESIQTELQKVDEEGEAEQLPFTDKEKEIENVLLESEHKPLNFQNESDSFGAETRRSELESANEMINIKSHINTSNNSNLVSDNSNNFSTHILNNSNNNLSQVEELSAVEMTNEVVEVSPLEEKRAIIDPSLFYQELINKNKTQLEIENCSLTFNKKTPVKEEPKSTKKKIRSSFAKIDNDKFSIVSEANNIKAEEEPAAEKQVTQSQVKSRRARSIAKMEIDSNEFKSEELEQEEKVNTRSMRNKKRFQSDKKETTKDFQAEEEEEQVEPEKKDKKKVRGKTKTKVDRKSRKDSDEEIKRGRSSNESPVDKKRNKRKKRSLSASEKESENEPETEENKTKDKKARRKSKKEKSKSKGPEKRKKK